MVAQDILVGGGVIELRHPGRHYKGESNAL